MNGRRGAVRAAGESVQMRPIDASVEAAAVAAVPGDAVEAMRMYGSWLRAVAVARLRGSQGADDVMQDVAAAALRNWSTLQSPRNAKPWLYRLTVRAALMHRRTLGRARKRVHEAAEMQMARYGSHGATFADPLESLLSSERSMQLRAALARMPSKDAELLLMKHVDDCSYKEIASRLGVTQSVVEMRLFRARQKLRTMLQNV